MHCPSCGSVLSRQVKFCTRCGAQTNRQDIEQTQERLDEYLDGLFWITVFGLGIILGGAALLTKALGFSRGVGIAYLILSSVAFLINFGLNLRETERLSRSLKKAEGESLEEARDTNKMIRAEATTPNELAQSVTENTTRSLEPIPEEHAAK